MSAWAIKLSAVGLLCGLLVGCGGGPKKPPPAPPPPPQPQTIAFATSGAVTGGAGTSVTNLASGGAGTGAITYESSNTAVATVNAATGVASLLTVGNTTITATKAASTGFLAATANYPLTVTQGSQTIAFVTTGPINAVLDSTMNNSANGGAGTGAISYASNNSSAVRVHAISGVASAVGVGSAVITATKAADANYQQAQASYTMNVQAASAVNAWIGPTSTQVFAPQSANNKQVGRARVTDCEITDTVASCDSAEVTPVTAATSQFMDGRATLSDQAYYSIVDNQTIGSPIVVSASRFSERFAHAAVRFNNRYWVIGGGVPIVPRVTPTVQYAQQSDVWSSEDGRSWKLETATAAFGKRWLHRAVVYQGAIWIIGGHAPERLGVQGINDVYRSTDGVNWTLVSSSLPTTGDPINVVATVFNNEIWIIRGGSVYSSPDGTRWTQKGSSLFGNVTRANATLTVFQGALWYIGGTPNFGVTNPNPPTVNASNEVFRSSADGTTWTQLTTPAPPFSPRFRHSSFVRNGRLWVFGGQGFAAGAVTGVAADAWSTDGSTWTQEVNTGRQARGYWLETVEEASPARVTIIGGLQGTYSNQVWQSSGAAAWEGRSSHAQFAPRHAEAVDFNGFVWVIGGAATNGFVPGNGDTNEVWRTADGLNWTNIGPTGPVFSPRDGHRTVVFNNQIWLIGGWENPSGGSGTRYNDVWSTADGTSWTQHATPPFSPRVGHEVVAYAGRLWVIAGNTASGWVNDVWSSADGETWRSETSNAAFSPRGSHQVVVFNNAMWLVAGGDSNGLSDAWSSIDGVTWTPRASPGFPARTWHSAAVANGRLYVSGGASSDNYETGVRYNDVWSTADGATWRQDTPAAGFSPRTLAPFVVRDNELWLIGGFGIAFHDDVWRSTDGVLWRVGFNHGIVAP